MFIDVAIPLRPSGNLRIRDGRHQRPASSNTIEHDAWLMQRYPHDFVFADTARNPVASRITHDSLATDGSRRFHAGQLYGLVFAEDADADCAAAVLPLMQQAYADSPTFRRLFNHHADLSAGVLCRLRADSSYGMTVTARQIEVARGHEMTFFVNAEGLPQAITGITARRAMMHELVHALSGLRDDACPENLRGGVVEYTNIIMADMDDEPARAQYGAIACIDDGRPEGVGESKDAREYKRIFELAEGTVKGWCEAAMQSIHRFSVEESSALRISCPNFDRMRRDASPSDFAKVFETLTEIHAGSAAPSAGLTNACKTFGARRKDIEQKLSLTQFTLDHLRKKMIDADEANHARMLCAYAGEQQQASVDARKQVRRVEEESYREYDWNVDRRQRDDRNRGLLQQELAAAASNPPIEKVAVETTTQYRHTTHSAQVLRDPHGRTLTGSGAVKPPLNEAPGGNSAETRSKNTATDTGTAGGMTQVARVDPPIQEYRTVTEIRMIEPNWRGQIRPHQLPSHAGEGSGTKTYVEEKWKLPQNVVASREHVMHTEHLHTSHRFCPAPGSVNGGVYALPKMPHGEPSDARYARPQLSHLLQPSQPSPQAMSAVSALSPTRFDGAIGKRSPWQTMKDAVHGTAASTIVKRPFPFAASPPPPPPQPSAMPPQAATEVVKRARQRMASPVLPALPPVAEHLPLPPLPMASSAIRPEPVPQQDGRLASMIEQLRGTTWDGDAIDLAVSLLVRLPEWPWNRILIIEDDARRLSNALLPPRNPLFAKYGGSCHGERIRQSLPADMIENAIRLQRVLLRGGAEHFNAIIDGRVEQVATDGDCFFRAALAARDQKLPAAVSDEKVVQLRNLSADYLQEHSAALAGFLGEKESLRVMSAANMQGDTQNAKKSPRPAPPSEQQRKLIETRQKRALQEWQGMTNLQRVTTGIENFAIRHNLARDGDRNYFSLTGLKLQGQARLDRLTGVQTIRLRTEHLIEWRDMRPEQREASRILGFAKRHKLNLTSCQRYMCMRGLTEQGATFLLNPPKRTKPDITFDVLQKWNAMTMAEREDCGGVRGFATKLGLNHLTLKNNISMKGIRFLPKKYSYPSQEGEYDSNGIVYAKQTASQPKSTISCAADISEKSTPATEVETVAACRKWEGMTSEQRVAITITGFARENRIFGWNAKEYFSMRGLKGRGQALLDKHDGVRHKAVTLAILQEWDEMQQEMRSGMTIVDFAKKNDLHPVSAIRYISVKGLTGQGRSLRAKLLSASCSQDISALLLKWEDMSAAERQGCGGVTGFCKKNKTSTGVLGNYISAHGLRRRGKIRLERRPVVPDIIAVRVVELDAQLPTVIAATATAATVAVKAEPIEAIEVIETINPHTYDNAAPYSRDPDNPERSLKPQSGKKLKIEMNRDLQIMLDNMSDAERLKITESVHDQVRQWIRDEGNVAAARMEALMETDCPVDDGPARGDSVFARQDIKKFQVIGCYGGKVLRFDDASYARECREHGAANIAAYAFGVADRNALLSGYRASNILSKINSVHPDRGMQRHPAWTEKQDNLRACSAGRHIVFITAIEDIAAGQELFLPYGDSYKMMEHRPIILKTEVDDDAQPDAGIEVGVEVGVPIADIDAYADTLQVMRIKGRKERRGGKTLLAATELTFLRSLPPDEGVQYALFNQHTGWHLLDERPAGTEPLPPRYRHLAPLISLSTQQRFEGQYYFYFAKRDVYLPVATTAISTEWRVQSPDGKDTVHLLKYDGDLKIWRCGAIVLT